MFKYALKYLSRILRTFVLIMRSRSPRPGKWAILFTYGRCWFKHVVFVKLLKRKIDRERIFGQRISFFNYSTFMTLFEEVFITQEYYFQSRTDRPFVIDGGANVGMTLLYLKLLYPQAKVLAFEPDEVTFKTLKQNVDENRLADVVILNAALSNQEGQIEFFTDPGDPGSLIMSTVPQTRMQAPAKMVQAVRLSSYINETVDFLKLDIEGAEQIVLDELKEARKLDSILEMVIEYHHHIVAGEDVLAGFLSVLEKSGCGYQLAADVRDNRSAFQNMLIYAYSKAQQNPPAKAA